MGLFKSSKHLQNTDLPNFQLSKEDFDDVMSLIIVDKQKKIIHINQQFYSDFGFVPQEYIGKSIHVFSVFYEESNDRNVFWKEHFTAKFSAYVKIENASKQLDFCKLKVIEKPNGQYWLLFDKITHEQQSFTSLKESVQLFTSLVNNTPDIICFKDGNGKWLFANDSDLELFHLKGVDYIGKTDLEIAEYTHDVYRRSFETCYKTDEKCWQSGEASRGDEIIQTPNGVEKVYDVIKIPVFNKDGSRKNLIVLGRDVSENRKVEVDLIEAKQKAEESDRLKSNFLATMSHELRTPLNAVIGFANLIYEEEDLTEIHEFARIINNNSKMLLNLIEDIFDVSLIESEQVQIDHSEFDLVKSIKEVYEIFPVELNMLDKLDIEFKIILDRDTFVLKGDEFRIKQILTNLIRNALKFTKKGFIHIGLKVSDKYWDLSVTDSGIGISEDKLQEIFGMFRQVEEGYKRSFGGAGLGLSISKRLAEMMRGDILVESELNKGSTFILRVPMD